MAHIIFILNSPDLGGGKTLKLFPERRSCDGRNKMLGEISSCSNLYGASSAYCTVSLCSPRTMAQLYGDPEWSQKDLEGPIRYAREHLAQSKLEAFSPERLASYRQELELRVEEGRPTTFVDLWALVLESMLHDQVGHLCMRGGALSAMGGAVATPQLADAQTHVCRVSVLDPW